MARERYFIFAIFGAILVALGLYAVRPDGVRSTVDTVVLYAGVAFLFIQIVIWIAAIARWINRRWY
jgi:hypothetical protein